MFEHWHEFYLLVGTAAGALIGLLFVVETLSTGFERDTALMAGSVYIGPLVFHFAMVLLLSCMALVPDIEPRAAAIGVALVTLAGLVWQVRIVWHLGPSKKIQAAHWSDIWWYGAWPLGAYLLLGGAGYNVLLGGTHAAPLLGAAAVVLMLLTIRNAWDLVSWMAPRAEKKPE